ncbi:cyclic nucleotide-binding domain-containing protein [Acetobacter lambici]|uniref:Crp/Fnr family transcriptional regulator n=1 Tax=Acetobacter lambici TaxID=1332824 RepID=UPI00140B8377|nr:Crp/Fnr family transcriptional regulator [Acetobacter lambici]NHO56058.1 cyclic nucleotide-binding domain-containing protein [Acetobacter lambici]
MAEHSTAVRAVTSNVLHVNPLHHPQHSGALCPSSPHILMAEAFSALERIWTDLKKPAKSVVFRQGESADFIYFIQSGALRLDYQLEDGRNLVLDFLWPDRFFGIVENEVYAWSAIALVDVHLKRLRRSAVQALTQDYPGVMDLLLKQKTASLMAAKNHIILMSCPTATSKLIGFLLDYSKRPEYFDRTTQVLTLVMSRKDIADYLGMTFETTSRIFKYLETRNYIKKINHRQIQLNTHMLLEA